MTATKPLKSPTPTPQGTEANAKTNVQELDGYPLGYHDPSSQTGEKKTDHVGEDPTPSPLSVEYRPKGERKGQKNRFGMYENLCQSTLKDGSQCRGGRMSGSMYCYFHDPDTRDDLRQQQAAGRAQRIENDKRRKHGQIPVPDLESDEDVSNYLVEVAHSVRVGMLDPAKARIIVQTMKLLMDHRASTGQGKSTSDVLRELLAEDDATDPK